MLSRRAFLERGSLAVGALAAMSLHAARAAEAQTGPLGKPIGLQLYTVRDAAAKDLPGTLRAIADIGYREVELAGIPATSATRPAQDPERPRPDRAEHAREHGGLTGGAAGAHRLRESARHAIPGLLVSVDGRLALSRQPGPAVVSLASGITLDDWKWNAEQLNKIGELANEGRAALGYHNHNMEFRSYDGVVGFDELLRLTDPALVTMEMDIAWVVTAGADPVQVPAEARRPHLAAARERSPQGPATSTADRLRRRPPRSAAARSTGSASSRRWIRKRISALLRGAGEFRAPAARSRAHQFRVPAATRQSAGTMRTIKGPAIFLAQFAGDAAPFDSLRSIAQVGREARLQRRADSDVGCRGCSISTRAAAEQDLLR